MTPSSPFVMIVDTDPGMALSLRHLFDVICGFSAEVLVSGDNAVTALEAGARPRVAILGKLADRDDLIARLQEIGGIFILVIDRQSSPCEAETAFLAGADDVIRAPFTLRELALRLRARIGIMSDAADEALLRDSSHWDSEAYIASRAGLTTVEAQIAHILISNNGEVVTRDTLSYAMDQRPWDYGDRKFDVHVANIRKKLTSVFGAHVTVNTVRSAGYVLTVDAEGYQNLLG
ncbi:phosphate regulon transcriptional regulator PhoB [Cognatishimia sp. WU-CL00825]|uniref:response regulator transcription factor n=1 Tax=Cognatishimia sp. WU-CL00825 TaxID=3127658 RepID=UPI0031039E06